jgi:hypothetical protein
MQRILTGLGCLTIGIALTVSAAMGMLQSHVGRPLGDQELRAIRGATGFSCDPCQVRWVGISDWIGGIECKHGKDPNNPDCAQIGCLEEVGQGTCRCFECSGEGCTDEFEHYMPWCGMKNNCTGSCGAPPLQGFLVDVLRSRPAETPNEDPCNFGGNGYMPRDFCPTGSAHVGCASSNCQGQGAWNNVKQGLQPLCLQ